MQFLWDTRNDLLIVIARRMFHAPWRSQEVAWEWVE
jgi:hypothetical protein